MFAISRRGARIALSHGRVMRCSPASSSLRHLTYAQPSRQAVPQDSHRATPRTNRPPPPPALPAATLLRTLYDAASDVTITLHPTTVALLAPSLGVKTAFHFDHVWLRDVCQEASSVEAASKQKLFHTSDIRSDAADGMLHVEAAKLLNTSDGVTGLPTLELVYAPQFAVTNAFSATFSSAPPPSTQPHISRVSLRTLLNHATAERYARSHGDVGGAARPWQASQLTPFPHSAKPAKKSSSVVAGKPALNDAEAFAHPSRIGWAALQSTAETTTTMSLTGFERARFALVDGLMRDGLAFVTGVPTDKTGDALDGDDAPNLAHLASMLGEIRHTFYGSLWNVRSLGASSRNIAYTNLDLGLHMDLCYFQNPPRFQFLHMLRNRVHGGQSIFVDSFQIAETMYAQQRDAWQTLTEVPVCFEYQNDARHYRYTHPTLELARPSSGHAGERRGAMPRLTAVNYSPPFQGALPLRWPDATSGAIVDASPARRRAFYAALHTFADLTHDARFRYERMLQEGECVVFDNRRVLHSRRGFEWDPAAEQSGGDNVKRWLKGCYVDGDAVWSTYRTLLAKARGGSLANDDLVGETPL